MCPDTRRLKRAYRKSGTALPFKEWALSVGEFWTSTHPLKAEAFGWCSRKSSRLGQAVS